MDSSEHDKREINDSEKLVIEHSDVDETAGDEGIDDAQPDDTEAKA